MYVESGGGRAECGVYVADGVTVVQFCGVADEV